VKGFGKDTAIERNKTLFQFYEITALMIYTLDAMTSAQEDKMPLLDNSDQTSRLKWWLSSVKTAPINSRS
jgi:hypothetical protein